MLANPGLYKLWCDGWTPNKALVHHTVLNVLSGSRLQDELYQAGILRWVLFLLDFTSGLAEPKIAAIPPVPIGLFPD